MTSLPIPRCVWYWGGCDPSRLDLALRELAGVFGFGPDMVAGFLVALVAVSAMFVLLIDPLPETWRGVGVRLTASLSFIAFYGHGEMILAALPISPMALWFLGVAAIGLIVAVCVVLRALELAQNLRGGNA